MKKFLKLLVSMTLVGLAVSFLDLKTMVRTMKNGSPISFFIAVLVNILTFAVLASRWRRLTVAQMNFPYRKNLALYFKATFLNTFTPANLGGDAYRLAVLRKESGNSGDVVKLLLRERIVGFYGYVIVFVLSYLLLQPTLEFHSQLRNPYIYGVAVSMGAFILPVVVRPLGGAMTSVLRVAVGQDRLPNLESYVETISSLLTIKGAIRLMFLTFCGIFLWIAAIKIVALGFGLSVPLRHLAAVAMLVEVIRLVPFTIQGIGLREGVFAYLLSFLGHNLEQCFVVGTVVYLALSVAIILCGPIGYALMWRGEEAT
jgi:uncharacterized protein (TIRG00374 family)